MLELKTKVFWLDPNKNRSHVCFSFVCPSSFPRFSFLIWKKMVFPLALFTSPCLWGDISDCPRMGEWDQECHQMSQYLCGEALS